MEAETIEQRLPNFSAGSVCNLILWKCISTVLRAGAQALRDSSDNGLKALCAACHRAMLAPALTRPVKITEARKSFRKGK